HVRIAFATNDERTAKRISEALGAKTELRSQKNYTGHRLAPWLSHMMVSRQETQRALMTPGEVMQMAPTDEVVMVSGTPPILAKKLRYFEDRNFTGRVLPAASVATIASQIVTVWTELVEGGPATVVPVRNAADEGGRDIAPVLDPPDRVVPPEQDQTSEPEIEDAGDAPGDQALETIRRAAALDLADDDTLPEF
ncbi:MAG: type IV secretory system conjugative DNA transfer family protein, partial [Notoacmeibacter sp.]|nr:type IV secretory system conjugative DNA transfer family protein [Notoacmeibacter sp.]